MATMYLYFGSSIKSVTVHANNSYYPKTYSSSGTTHTLSNLPSSGNIWIVPSNDVTCATGYGTPINITTQNPSGSWELDNDNYISITNGRSITLTATQNGGGGGTTYTTYGLNLRTGTGISSYNVKYLGSSGLSYNTATVSNSSASTVCWTRANTNLEITNVNYSANYGPPYYFVEYTDSTFSTIKKTFADNDGQVYSSGTRYVKLFGTKEITYTVKLYGNGGEWTAGPDPQSTSIKSGAAINLASYSRQLNRQGYTLKGWDKSQYSTTPSYGTNTVITVNSDITLYAVWESNIKPHIILDANGGRFEGTLSSKDFYLQYGDGLNLSNYKPAWYGNGLYELAGWRAGSPPPFTENPPSFTENPTYGINEVIGPFYSNGPHRYYAVWKAKEVEFYFKISDSDEGVDSAYIYVNNSLKWTLQDNTLRTCKATLNDTIQIIVNTKRITANGININSNGFNPPIVHRFKNNAEIGKTSMTISQEGSINTLPQFNPYIFTFSNWADAKIEFRISAAPKSYSVILDPNGGKWNDGSLSEKQTRVYSNTPLYFSSYSNQITRDSAQLGGWSINASGSNLIAPTGSAWIVNDSARYYAIWKEQIELFYWFTDQSDENKIKTNAIVQDGIKAEAWNRLQMKILILSKKQKINPQPVINSVEKGDLITANGCNKVAQSINNLQNHGNDVPMVNQQDIITAQYFIILRNRLNTAIMAFNGTLIV